MTYLGVNIHTYIFKREFKYITLFMYNITWCMVSFTRYHFQMENVILITHKRNILYNFQGAYNSKNCILN